MKAVENIKPARLSQLKYEEIYGKTVVAAGWGYVTVTGHEPRFLQRANLLVMDKKICEDNLIEFDLSHDIPNHFCTVGKNQPITLGCVRHIFQFNVYIVVIKEMIIMICSLFRVTAVGRFS